MPSRLSTSTGGWLRAGPRERGQLAAALLVVAVSDLGRADLALPPGDAAHSGGPGAPASATSGSVSASRTGAQKPGSVISVSGPPAPAPRGRRSSAPGRAAGCSERQIVPAAAIANTSEPGSRGPLDARLRRSGGRPRGRSSPTRRRSGRRPPARRRSGALTRHDRLERRLFADALDALQAGLALLEGGVGDRSAPLRSRPRPAGARSFQVPGPVPMPGMRPSHFSATAMCAWTHSSWSGTISSGRWWIARTSAVSDLAARLADLQAEVQVVAVEAAQVLVEADVAHRPGRQDQEEAVERLDLADARVGRRLAPVPGEGRQVAAAMLFVAVDERASVTEPSHQAMLRTPIAPTQPTRPTSGSARAARTLAHRSGSTISVSWWTSTSASRSSCGAKRSSRAL